jgi:hypothetical protein
MMDERELVKRCRALPGRFADRLSPKDLADVEEFSSVGEWDEEVDLLLSGLNNGGQTISAKERDEIKALLDHMQMSHDRLNTLGVTG